MIAIPTKKYENTTKVYASSMAASTNNCIALISNHKKYLNTRTISDRHLPSFEYYIYQHLLKPAVGRSNSLSFIGVTEIKIQKEKVVIGGHQTGVSYHIQRLFVDQLLRAKFQSSLRIKKNKLKSLAGQLLMIFMNTAQEQLPVICPANLRYRNKFDGDLEIELNRTSFSGYTLLIAGEHITVNKFKEIYCYLHPQSYNEQTKTMEINFRCKLYSFAINLFSLLYQKEVTYPLYLGKNQLTIDIETGMEYIKKSQLKIEDSFRSKIVGDQIKKKQKEVGFQFDLFKFFRELFFPNGNKYVFNSWWQVIDKMYPDYLRYFIENMDQLMFQALETVYSDEKSEKREFYKQMGIIKEKCSQSEDERKKELVFYFLSKFRLFGLSRFRVDSKEKGFHPQLYIEMKNVEKMSRDIVKKREEQATKQQNLEEQVVTRGFDCECRLSRRMNITYMEGAQLDVPIYLQNSRQEVLSAWESNIWL